jgi:hypothetical protein
MSISHRNEKTRQKALKQLEPGESFIFADGHKNTAMTIAGIMPLIIGVILLLSVAFDYLGPRAGAERVAGEIATAVFMFAVGLVLVLIGNYAVFLSKKNYFFVTDKRLCLRGRNLWFLPKNRDIPVDTIREVRQAIGSRKRGSRPIPIINVVLNDRKQVSLSVQNLSGMIAAIEEARASDWTPK